MSLYAGAVLANTGREQARAVHEGRGRPCWAQYTDATAVKQRGCTSLGV